MVSPNNKPRNAEVLSRALAPKSLNVIEHTDLFQRLVLGLGEQKVRYNSVGYVGADIDQKVLPTEFVESTII